MKKSYLYGMTFLTLLSLPAFGVAQSDCTNEIVINFDDFTVGTSINTHLEAQGVSLLSVLNANPQNPDIAVIFDSANPGGGDTDLGTPNESVGGPGVGSGEGNTEALGNILIIGENDTDNDGDSLIDVPDDESRGGDLMFNFTRPSRVKSITFVDTETQGVGIAGFKNNNTVSFLAGVAALGGNSVQSVSLLALNPEPSARLLISIRESTAIAELVLCPEDATPFRKATRINSACASTKRNISKRKGRRRLRAMRKGIRSRLSKAGRRSLQRGICG